MKFYIVLLISFLFLFFFLPVSLAATPQCMSDINGDAVVDVSDYAILATNFLKSPIINIKADINGDGIVDVSDYSILATNFLKAATGCTTPTPVPTSTPTGTVPPTTTGEWTQFGHDAARTDYTAQTVSTPWKYKWQWNGADANGKRQSNHLSVPNLVQPITGGGRIYMVASNQVVALDKTTGNVLWTKGTIGTLSATGAYDSEFVYVPSSDGHVYKLNASTGATVSSFIGAGSFATAILFANGNIFAGSSNGTLYAINPTNMSQVWSYAAGAAIVTPAAYSPSKNTVIVNSQDLYVHAINASNGTRIWRVKPTIRTYTTADPTNNLTDATNGWPVIAEQHGVVLVRYRAEWQTLWNGPSAGGTFPDLNVDARNFLVANPKNQVVFAMKLTDGSPAFIPNVGNGGAGDGGTLPMGTQPIIRNINGTEVGYIVFRNRQNCARFNYSYCDGRSDAIMGEMALDNTSVPGYVAGDMRIIDYEDIRTDEEMNITMSGATLFHGHWLVSAAKTITDRSSSLGNAFANPIKTTNAPYVIWRQCNGTNTCNYPGCTANTYCGVNCATSTSRYCSQGLYGYGDARQYPAGFYEYNNDIGSGSTPFTVVSANQVLVKTDDGGLIVMENGNPLADGDTSEPIAQSQNNSVLGANITQDPLSIGITEGLKHLNQKVSVTGTIASVVNHLPKAIYLSFTPNHSDSLLVRVFQENISKFNYDLSTLKGKTVQITGLVTLYWPEGKDPEIIVTDPSQIVIK